MELPQLDLLSLRLDDPNLALAAVHPVLATTTTSASAGWVDPLLGVRLALPLSEAFAFTFRGMLGGFGVGCDFTWDVDARVKWKASKSVTLSLGYRYLDQDYEKDGGFKWDVVSQGPLAGASLTF